MKFILTLTCRSDTINDIQTIEAGSLTELVSKFMIIIAGLKDSLLMEWKGKMVDDDIPF